MPRIRTLKPEIWQDEALGSCPPTARLLYIGLITQADDEGRFRAAPALVKSAVFPYDLKLGLAMIEGHLEALAKVGLIRLYTVRGQSFGELPTWSQHQRVSHPSPSVLPKFEQRDKSERTPPFAGDSVKAPEDSGGFTEGSDLKGREGNRSKTYVEFGAQNPAYHVWAAYLDHHPRAKLLAQRRDLIKRRLNDYDAETLIAAIVGNHRDPFCNGENADRRQYHSLELILRDADHIERYADLGRGTANGNGREITREEMDEIERRAIAGGYQPGDPADIEALLQRDEEEVPY